MNIQQGTYKARAREWALGMSANGKEQIAVLFELIGGEYAGQLITWFGYFTDAAVDRTLDSLRHCGWSSDSLAELDGLDQNEVEIVVEEDTYEGKTRSKVRWVNRPSRLALKEQMTPQAMQAFAAKLRGRTVAHKQKYGSPHATSAAQPSAANSNRQPAQQQLAAGGGAGAVVDDDIPFAPVGNVG